MPTVYIIIYSLYHHIYTLALDAKKGLESQGINVKLFQVPETLSEEILVKLNAPPKPDIPVITVDALTEADAFLFGVPTRFGTFPAQMKSFLDATGALWASGALAGKFAGTFFSTASQHGGQETTAYTMLTYFAHHGINYVPLGFANSHLFDNSEVVGGSAYGAGTVANGDGSRQPSQKELEIAQTQGENFGKLLVAFHRGLGLATEKPVENKEDEIVPVNKEAATTGTEAGATAAAAAVTNDTPAPELKEREIKEESKPETKPKTEEKPKPVSKSPKKEEKKEHKCFCM